MQRDAICSVRDRAAFRDLIKRCGAELVLHGHQHHSHFGGLDGPLGRIPVIGVSSASAALVSSQDRAAQWNLFNVQKTDTGWRLEMEGRILTKSEFKTRGRWYTTVPRN